MEVLINKRCYLPKGVPGDITDANFKYKEVGDVEIFEARTQENKPFKYFV